MCMGCLCFVSSLFVHFETCTRITLLHHPIIYEQYLALSGSSGKSARTCVSDMDDVLLPPLRSSLYDACIVFE
jgi:hypothetical protein